MPTVLKAVSPSSGTGTYSEISLFDDIEIPAASRAKVSKEVGEFIVDKINEYLTKTTSPVAGKGAFKQLNKDYAKYKRSTGVRAVPNLELTGAMRDNLSYKVSAAGVQVGVFSRNEADKADGHNNFSGKSTLPQRRFLPEKGESFKSEITKGINEIIAREKVKQGAFGIPDLSSVTSEASFKQKLREAFPGASLTTIYKSILTNPDFVDQLDQAGFLKWIRK